MTTFVFTQALNAINSRASSVSRKFNSSPLGQLTNYIKDQTSENVTWKKDKISGKLSEISLQTSTYNKIIPLVYGTNKIAGNIIWLGDVREVRNDNTTTIQIGKGQKIKQTSIDYFYYLSFAVALCHGEISELKNVWADSTLLDMNNYSHRFYPGTSDQMPDSLLEAIDGVGRVSAYRDLCYIVFEDFPLSEFNNRIPNFLFEITRKNEIDAASPTSLENCIGGLNLAPAAGEYTFSPSIQYQAGEQFAPDVIDTVDGIWYPLNEHNNSKMADGLLSLNQALKEFKNCEYFSPQVAFFGDHMDIKKCTLKPRVTFNYFPTTYPIFTRPDSYAVGSTWNRYNTPLLGKNSDGSFHFLGGTPSDGSLLDFFKTLKDSGKKTVFHPKILMDMDGTPSSKGLSGDISFIETFFTKTNGYNDFILHYADLLKGYVDIFLLGDELLGITALRDNDNNFPAVAQLLNLAKKVRDMVGDNVKISYAAGYTEYHSIDGYYALDKLWASNYIDFVGINAYFPLTNASQDSITREIIKNSWTSGEGYDYITLDGKQTPVEPKYAYKNMEYWWSNSHSNPDGSSSDWTPKMKKIYFTEYGFCSVDGVTNEPYKGAGDFPRYSLGSSDFFAQRIAIEATEDAFRDSDYVEKRFVYYWDMRPYPFYPNRTDLWTDGTHWKYDYALNGKTGISNANILIYQLFRDADISLDLIKSIEVDEFVDGFVINNSMSVQDALYILQKVYFFDCIEDDNGICFISNRKSNRDSSPLTEIYEEELLPLRKSSGAGARENNDNYINTHILANNELPKRLTIIFLDKNNDYDTTAVYAERLCADSNKHDIETLPVVLDAEKARNIAETLLYTAWVERISFSFRLPPKYFYLANSDLIKLYCEKCGLILKISNMTLEDSSLWVEASCFDASIYDYKENRPLNPNLEILGEVGNTNLKILELPALNQNMLSDIFVFLVSNGEFLSWNGANIYYSSDPLRNYRLLGESISNSPLGRVINIPVEARPYYFDYKNKLKISFHGGVDNNAFKNMTDMEIYNGENLALYGEEILQFKYIKLENDGSYSVSGLLRGLYGTEYAINDHRRGDKFLILDENYLFIQRFAQDKINFNYYYRAVSFGNAMGNAKIQSHTLAAKNLKPLAPCHIRVKKVDSDGSCEICGKYVDSKYISTGPVHVDKIHMDKGGDDSGNPNANDDENNNISSYLLIDWQEHGRGYRNWTDNADYISAEENGKFEVEIWARKDEEGNGNSGNNENDKNGAMADAMAVLATLTTQDRSLKYPMPIEVKPLPLKIRIRHWNSLCGWGDWSSFLVVE